MSGILRLESLTKGNTLKQGDKTPLKYRLFDADGEKLNIAGKSAVARLMYPDFLRAGYESEPLTVSSDNTVTFSIDKIIQPVLYYLEITVDGKYIFPSRNDESKLNIDKSSQGSDVAIIEIIGKDVLVRDIKNMVDSEIEPVVNDMIISNQKVLENEQVVQEVNILSKQLEERQNQVEQFNNQVITEMTDKDVISAPEIILARGEFDTLDERLNDTDKKIKVSFEQFGAVGDGVTDDTNAIQQAIDFASANRLPIECPTSKVYKIKKVGTIRYSLGGVNNTSGYAIKVPSNTRIDFSGSVILMDDADYGSFFINDGVFNSPKTLNENIYLNNLHCVGGVDTVEVLSGTYDPCINFVKVENVSIPNAKFEKVFDCGLRVIAGKKINLGSITVDNVRGNGVYLGLHNDPLEDLRVHQVEINSINCFDIREGGEGVSCNPLIACLKDANINSISAINSAMGFKIQNESENVNINSVLFDGGDLSTVNSGLKIQGLSDDELLIGVNIGNVISRNCKGAGLYIQYSKNVNVGNYIGENNGRAGTSDVWLHKENISINSINITKAHSSGVQTRGGSFDIKINNVTANDVKGNVIIDNSELLYIDNVTVKGSDVNFPTDRLYISSEVNARSLIGKITRLSENLGDAISIVSPHVSIKRLELSRNHKLEFTTTLNAGTRTDIMNPNIIYQNNGSGGMVRPFVIVNQQTGNPINITNQQYITGGYRLTHETALGTEQILISIRDVHI